METAHSHVGIIPINIVQLAEFRDFPQRNKGDLQVFCSMEMSQFNQQAWINADFRWNQWREFTVIS